MALVRLITIAVAIFGCVVTGLGIADVFTAAATVSWPQTKAVITKSELAEEANGRQSVLEYSYRAEGREFTGRMAFPGDRGVADGCHIYACLDYPQGSTQTVRYSPVDPSIAYLEAGIHRHTFLLLWAGSMLFSVGVLFTAVSVIAPKYGKREPDGSYFIPFSSPAAKYCGAALGFIAVQFLAGFYLCR